MSDDDCDIFHMAVKRANAVPQVPVIPDFECKNDDDYDFIEGNKTIKKKVKSMAKKGSPKKRKIDEDANMNQLEELAPSARASLSPVSQLINEMEEKGQETKAKQIDSLPVAKRTRNSLAKIQITGEENAIKETSEKPGVKLPILSPPKLQAGHSSISNQSKKNTRWVPKRAIRNSAWRNQLGERAARAKVIDTIDLVSAVMPRVEGFINLDSDEDDANEDKEKAPTEPLTTFDDENPVVDINLNWQGEMQTYQLRKYQKLSHMFKEVAQRNGLSESDVEVTFNDTFLSPTESCESLGLRCYHILCGHWKNKSLRNPPQPKEAIHVPYWAEPNEFQLKIQSDKWKRPKIIKMKKSETFKILYIKVAEYIECNPQHLKLFFDGYLLHPDDTPTNQDMEGNERIDLHFK